MFTGNLNRIIFVRNKNELDNKPSALWRKTMLSRPRTYIAVIVVTNVSNMASYFPEAGNLNGSNADMCSDVAEPSSSGSSDFFEFSDRSNKAIILLCPHY